MQRVVIKGIGSRKTALNRDELTTRIALEADEEEASVDLAGAWFGRF